MRRFGPLLGAVLLAAGCAPTMANRGNLVPDTRLEQVQVGVSTQGDVAGILGSPSAVSTFDPNTWYYIGQVTETGAFDRTRIVDRRVVVVHFNDTGVVSGIDQRTLEDGQQVEVVERETPTLGRRMTFLEQILGNLGRFNN